MSATWNISDHQRAMGPSDQSHWSGIAWGPEPLIAPEDENEAEATELAVGDFLFSEQEMAMWNGTQAILWIIEAGNSFEVLGLRPKPQAGMEALRRRYRRLSLLTHPDKNPAADAAAAFKKLTDSMKVLSREEDQLKLLKHLFPKLYGSVPAQKDTAKQADGFYDTARSREDMEANRRLEQELLMKLQEEAERQASMQEDELQAFRLKHRQSLADLLRAQKQRSKGLGPKPSHSDMEEQKPKRIRKEGPEEGKGPSGWRLPEEFMPPAAGADAKISNSSAKVCKPTAAGSKDTGPKAGAEADPNTLWSLTGATGLAANGWQRLESRSSPGRFYFLHAASGRREMAAKEVSSFSITGELPAGWQKRASRSKPGVFFYVNKTTGETRMDPPGSCAKKLVVGNQAQGGAKENESQAGKSHSVQPAENSVQQAWPWDNVPSMAEYNRKLMDEKAMAVRRWR
eukprot:TRINITY_DN44714_c0_g1_i1.p1 TRINITY_DN44714_c0_g1~~TRINITY_DN44714_c0_g1_i1.p1  ORF type:complete len:457 (-),score=90.28 TRINITY_DN44714_c0_g1_i1:75-1445(-)